MNTDTQSKYVNACAEISRLIEGDNDFFLGYFAANAIRNSTHLLYGAPGVGKTTLIRITGKVMFEDETVIVNHYEGVSPEDTIFAIHPGIKDMGGGDSRYTFDPEPMPYLSSRFALMNEMNRAGAAYQNSFLSILEEGQISVRGVTLKKTPGITWIDYNPYKGSFDPAFIDRALSGHTMEEVGIAGQIRIAGKKYDHTNDPNLVSQAKKILGFEEMEQVWDDVAKVRFPSQLMGRAQILLSMFSACKEKWGSMTPEYQKMLSCGQCDMKKFCALQHLKRPVLTRALDSFVMMAKALAYVGGRDTVDEEKDFRLALKHSVSHRLLLKDKKAAANNDVWFDQVATPLMPTKAAISGAKETIKGVKEAMDSGEIGNAIKVYSGTMSALSYPATFNLVREFCLDPIKAAIQDGLKALHEDVVATAPQAGKVTCSSHIINTLKTNKHSAIRAAMDELGLFGIPPNGSVNIPENAKTTFGIKGEDIVGDLPYGAKTCDLMKNQMGAFLAHIIRAGFKIKKNDQHTINIGNSTLAKTEFSSPRGPVIRITPTISASEWGLLSVLKGWVK